MTRVSYLYENFEHIFVVRSVSRMYLIMIHCPIVVTAWWVAIYMPKTYDDCLNSLTILSKLSHTSLEDMISLKPFQFWFKNYLLIKRQSYRNCCITSVTHNFDLMRILGNNQLIWEKQWNWSSIILILVQIQFVWFKNGFKLSRTSFTFVVDYSHVQIYTTHL